MSTQLVTIGNTQIPLVQYNGQPVVTFTMIDKVHCRPEGTASRNFLANRERFTEGQHFYLVDFSKNNEFRPFGIEIPPRGLTVLTERGYLTLVKSFTDDLAWEVQDKLIDSYFRVKQTQKMQVVSSDSVSFEQMMQVMESMRSSMWEVYQQRQTTQELQQTLSRVEEDVAELKAILPTKRTHSTVKAHAIVCGKPLNYSQAAKIGKRCAFYCRQHGIPIMQVDDDHYGTVNAYPIDILDGIFEEEQKGSEAA
jgi:hypothetical protein